MKPCWKSVKPCAIFLVAYIIVVISYGYYSYESNKSDTLKNLDDKLLMVAYGMKAIAPDLMHPAQNLKHNKSTDRHMESAATLLNYARRMKVAAAYILRKKGDTVFYEASSRVDKHLTINKNESHTHKFMQDPPEKLLKVFASTTPVFLPPRESTPSRTLLVPEKTDSGETILFGVDADSERINARIQKRMFYSISISACFILLVIPFIIIFKKSEEELTNDFKDLKEMLSRETMDKTAKLEKKIDDIINK